MNLTILLPFRIFAKLDKVSCIIVETLEGSFGLLPHRLDCAAALVPGILKDGPDDPRGLSGRLGGRTEPSSRCGLRR